MAIRNWANTYGSWYLPGNWTTVPPAPNNFPQPGDDVFITSGDPSLGASHGVIDQLRVTLGGSLASAAATLDLLGATLGSGLLLVSDAQHGFATLDVSGQSALAGTLLADAPGGLFVIDIPGDAPGQSFTMGGTLAVENGDRVRVEASSRAAFVNTGSITVEGGTLDVQAGDFVNSGTIIVGAGGGVAFDSAAVLQGQGTIELENGGGVSFGGAVPYVQTIDFLSTGTLTLADPAGFYGLVTGFGIGDALDLPGGGVNWVMYAAGSTGGRLYYGAAGSDGKTSAIRIDGVPSGYQLGAQPDGHGGVLVQAVPVSRFLGGTQDWYQAGSWSTNAVPGPGDYVQIGAGTVTIGAADVSANGPLASLQVVIGASDGTPTLAATDETIADDTSITTASVGSGSTADVHAAIMLDGTTTLDGAITARTSGGQLALTIGAAGGAAVLTLGTSGILDTSSETGFVVSGGTLVNAGTLQSGGLMTIDASTTLTGSGTIQLVSAGSIVLDGVVGAGQQIEMISPGEMLGIGDLAGFAAQLTTIAPGDTLDVLGQVIDGTSYDAANGALTLLDGGNVLGMIALPAGLAGGFALQADDQGGTDILYQPPIDPNTGTLVADVLPVAAAGTAGSTISLATLLVDAFGSIPADCADYKISYEGAAYLDANNLSYWDPSNPSVTGWVVNGTEIAPGNTVDVTDINDVSLVLGNNIDAQAHLIVPIQTDADGHVLQSLDYSITTVDPAIVQPNVGTTEPNATDLLDAATASQALWGTPLNNNDCPNISNVIGAAAGAVHPDPSTSTDPDNNVDGGFWRVVYRGTQADPVSNWYSLLQPGEFVRMAWNTGGPHTTSIMGMVQPDGSVSVYDNADPVDPTLGISGIGFHDPTYWPKTDPSSITIYQLTNTGQYLIDAPAPATGAEQGDIIQGSVYDNLIHPTDLADVIALGPQTDEVQGSFAQLDNDTVQNWHAGDLLDLTDVAPSAAGLPDYDAGSGALTMQAGAQTLAMQLPTGLTGPFIVAADGAGGTYISELPCFAAGTRIRTPRGDVAVEHLRVGERVVTASGRAAPIRWIGSRRVSCAAHPHPARVLPVRVRAGAFGENCPRRDVLLSPDHAVFVHDVLIPVHCLIDGDAVRRMPATVVTYFHVELDRHDILLAEGMAVESYLDTGNRAAFADGTVVALHPEFAPDDGSLAWEALACAPLRVTGPAVERARAGLRARMADRTAARKAGCGG